MKFAVYINDKLVGIFSTVEQAEEKVMATNWSTYEITPLV
jgi:hypothetical protein